MPQSVLGYNLLPMRRRISIWAQGTSLSITAILICAPTTPAKQPEEFCVTQHLIDIKWTKNISTSNWNAKDGNKMTSGITEKSGLGIQNKTADFNQNLSMFIENISFQPSKICLSTQTWVYWQQGIKSTTYFTAKMEEVYCFNIKKTCLWQWSHSGCKVPT